MPLAFAATSSLPSPLKSPSATERVRIRGEVVGGGKREGPDPVAQQYAHTGECGFATTRSGLPSPLKSPTATTGR